MRLYQLKKGSDELCALAKAEAVAELRQLAALFEKAAAEVEFGMTAETAATLMRHVAERLEALENFQQQEAIQQAYDSFLEQI